MVGYTNSFLATGSILFGIGFITINSAYYKNLLLMNRNQKNEGLHRFYIIDYRLFIISSIPQRNSKVLLISVKIGRIFYNLFERKDYVTCMPTFTL